MPVILDNNEFDNVPLDYLSSDKQNVMEFASTVASTAIPTKNELSSRAATLSAEITATLNPERETPDYSAAIKQLHELRDTKNGILWKENSHDGVVVRDARAQDSSPVNGSEAFQIMALNYARASHVLLEEALKRGDIDVEEQKSAAEKITRQTYDIYSTLATSNHQEEDFKKHNAALLDSLAEGLGVEHKVASKQLNVAKDYMNFEDRHVHSVTLSTVKHDGERYTICEAETMMLGMTDSQKAEMENRKDKSWYKEQSPAERSLTDRYAEQISDGKHTIPTQLRGIPGIRNAYTKTTAIAKEGEKLEVVHEGHHSGTVASQAKGGKEEQQRIADQNVEQLAEIIGKPIHMVTLNSPNNPTGNDKAIVEQTGKATGGHHTNLAFNFARRIVGANKMNGLDETFKAVSDHAKDLGQEAIASYVSGKGSLKAAQAELESVEGSSKRMFAAAINASQNIRQNSSLRTLFGVFDSENRNLTIASELSIVRHEMRDEVHQEKFKDVPEEVSACQSGKDRNGMKLFNQSAEAVGRALTAKTSKPVAMEEVRDAMSNAGHTQNQAGNQGGTLGCYGIKGDTRGAIPESFSATQKDTLVQKTASYNGKIKEAKPSRMEKIKAGVTAGFISIKKALSFKRNDEPEFSIVTQQTDTLELAPKSETPEDVSKLPLAERLERMEKYLDGTEKSKTSDRPLVPLVAMNQIARIPIEGSMTGAGERALGGAKAWLTEQDVDADKSDKVMLKVAEQAPWLVGALATKPVPNGDVKFIMANGNTYAKSGEPGEFAANYRAEALLLDNVQERFVALAKEKDPSDPEFTQAIKGMQDEILEQVMKSSAFLPYSKKSDVALTRTIQEEGVRNPALFQQFEQEYKPEQQKKSGYIPEDVTNERRVNSDLRNTLGGERVVFTPEERKKKLVAIENATQAASSMKDTTYHNGVTTVEVQKDLANNKILDEMSK